MALARWQRTITTGGGIIVPGASVEVRRESDNGLASLFSDRAGAVGIGNPFTADSEGFAAFHVVGGAYKITASFGATVRTWRYVGVGLAQEFDVDQLVITYANLPDMAAGTTLGRVLGTGTGDPVALAALEQFANAVASGGPLWGPGRVLVLSTTPVSLTAAQSGMLITNANATRTVNFPAPATGLCYAFAHTGTGALNLDTPGSEVIIFGNGNTSPTGSLTSAGGGFAIAVSDGVNWFAYCVDSQIISASTTIKGIVEMATANEYRANTANDNLGLSINQTWLSADFVALTNTGGTIAVDMSTGYNFSLNITSNQTLGNPSNIKNGQTGCIRVTQDGTGSRTLAYAANWDFAAGAAPVLSTAPSARDALFYVCESATSVIVTGIVKGIS